MLFLHFWESQKFSENSSVLDVLGFPNLCKNLILNFGHGHGPDFQLCCQRHQTFNKTDRVYILREYRAICLWKIDRQIFAIIDYKALMNINRCKCLSIIDGSVFLFSRICASKKSALNRIGLFIIASTSIKT